MAKVKQKKTKVKQRKVKVTTKKKKKRIGRTSHSNGLPVNGKK